MSDQETIILVVAIAAAFLALMLLNMREWSRFMLLMGVILIACFFYMFLDREGPRELNQTILEQQREKWRHNKEEKINGSRD